MRQSTTEHTRQTFLRIQERQVQSKRKKGGPNYDRPLTQEELLEEAKITEEINLRSLGERGTRRPGEGVASVSGALSLTRGMSLLSQRTTSVWRPTKRSRSRRKGSVWGLSSGTGLSPCPSSRSWARRRTWTWRGRLGSPRWGPGGSPHAACGQTRLSQVPVLDSSLGSFLPQQGANGFGAMLRSATTPCSAPAGQRCLAWELSGFPWPRVSPQS